MMGWFFTPDAWNIPQGGLFKAVLSS